MARVLTRGRVLQAMERTLLARERALRTCERVLLARGRMRLTWERARLVWGWTVERVRQLALPAVAAPQPRPQTSPSE